MAEKTREHPMPGQVLAVVNWHAEGEYDSGADRELTDDLEAAHVVTSRTVRGAGGTHKPVLDIDLPAKLLPSSTEGHWHLLIDREMPWDRYAALLEALAAAGVIEPGYAEASIARGYSSVRLPWVKKGGEQ